MSTTSRIILQAVIAGVVASLVLLGVRGAAFAQWGDSSDSSTTEEAPAEEDPPAPVSPVGDPCSILTQAEADAALGTGSTTMNDSLQCTYIADDLTGRAVSVAVTGDIPTDEGALEGAMNQMATALNGSVTPSSLGEDAYFVNSEILSQIAVRHSSGQTVIVVLTSAAGTDEAVRALLSDLATSALERI